MSKTCKECSCQPCQCDRIKEARKNGEDECIVCGTELHLRGGYVGTDMCGVCCTGDSELLEQEFIEW